LLGSPLTAEGFALVVAETAALAWSEGSESPASFGQRLRLPAPMTPLEALLERPGSEAMEAALARLHTIAAQVKESGSEDLYERFLGELAPQERSRHRLGTHTGAGRAAPAPALPLGLGHRPHGQPPGGLPLRRLARLPAVRGC